MITIILQMKTRKRWIKNLILVIYVLKVINMMIGTKKNKEKSKSHPEETIAKRVKLIPQKRKVQKE